MQAHMRILSGIWGAETICGRCSTHLWCYLRFVVCSIFSNNQRCIQSYNFKNIQPYNYTYIPIYVNLYLCTGKRPKLHLNACLYVVHHQHHDYTCHSISFLSFVSLVYLYFMPIGLISYLFSTGSESSVVSRIK